MRVRMNRQSALVARFSMGLIITTLSSIAPRCSGDSFPTTLSGNSAAIPKGSSALFVLFKSVAKDKVLPEIQPYKPRILKTSLSNEAEAKLRAALSKVA